MIELLTLEFAASRAEIPELRLQSGLAEDLLRFLHTPFMPAEIAVRAVPESSQSHDLMQWNGLSRREPMPLAPRADLFRRVKWQHQRAVLVYVLPGSSRRNRKVHPNLIGPHRLSFNHWDGERLSFAAKPRVDSYLAADHGRNAKRTPNAGSPPSSPLALDPVERGRQ
jgi:hypothetical protein